ncbi:dnaJ-like protein 60 [Uranotaenia lowii]|uniref:dnaJ-like protein 60 n=1 Tax=Uranotaenia lowii TaxID=190385 RepID=UPI0024791D51|nr:dnaJ-like protein 60 [Uranotaenia lowii]
MFKLTRHSFYTLFTPVQGMRYAHQINYYDVLKVKPSSSTKEIRESFIKLSKELHPDATLSHKSNEKSFVQLLEAYKVLSKPDSRADHDYDLFLNKNTQGQQSIRYSGYQTWKPNVEEHTTPDPDFYYGIKGVKRVSNWTIVICCGVFMVIGVIVQVIAINNSFTFKRQQLDEASRKSALAHAEARAEAESLGNEGQIAKMKAKLNKEAMR